MAAFTLNLADLAFILRQIKVSEAHAAGMSLTEIYVDAAGNVVPQGTPGAVLAIPDPHVPVGLRTVDGRDNNIVPGREHWGAADNAMPRMLDPNFGNDADGDVMPLGGGAVVTNTDYDVIGAPGAGNGGHSGNVADADPRIISNLVVDMSINNRAAIVAALTVAGSADPYADAQRLIEARVTQAEADAAVLAAQAALGDANAALAAAVAGFTPADPSTIDVIQQAAAAVTVAEETLDQALITQADPNGRLEALAGEMGLEIVNGSLVIPNVAPDEGLSAPFNAWMTFFGQFFDHGLDLISKGNNGTVFIPLQPDDPLVTHGPDGVAGSGDEVQPQNAFMVVTRSTPVDGPGADGVMGTADDTHHEARNTTTPFVDQNQTYTSHASHQVFLREYATVGGVTVATGRLLDGANGGLPTWADIKTQAREMLGIELTDADVVNLPLLRTDQYGNFIPDPSTGYAQVIVGLGADGIPNTADDIVVSGTPAAPVNTFAALAIRTGHAFLDDIAHAANPFDGQTGQLKIADDDSGVGLSDSVSTAGRYDNELLDRHFITGDGRGNENIGLTAVHHIFHSEHNRQVDSQKLTILQSGDLAFINEWLATDLASLPVLPAAPVDQLAFAATLDWDGERLFQAARFATEMQYQHLVFEEFARKIQPAIDPFVFNSTTDIDPSIFAEFAHTVYRFGHSMLTEGMPRIDANGNPVDPELNLIEAFLNPVSFDIDGTISAEAAAGSIVRGMTIERGNEIDEFVVNALRNNLLGLPLDLAAINIARGRDTGVPTLNDAREQLYAATSSTFLKPYDHWADFAANLKNPASVINFIAAYGTHPSIPEDGTLQQKRDAATLLVMGDMDLDGDGVVEIAPADRIEFLTSTGAWANQESGLNLVDLWIGGLAEKKMPFGGMLGSTFNAVFEAQLENLQDGDRFYYLTRTQGQNFLNALEQNSFAKMIMANTDIADPGPDGIRGTPDDIVARHIGVDSFAKYDFVLEVNPANQADYNGDEPGVDPLGADPVLESLGLGKVIRDDPGTVGPDANYIRVSGGEHVVVGGTQFNDTIITDFGDDGIWGDVGDDRIESGAGVDLVNGGAGDDIITDSGDSGDFLKGDEGDDVIANSNGLDILMGGSGKDAIFVGVDDTEVFGGDGDDFILGGAGVDFLLGNEGDDWMEAGPGFDTTAGDNSELFFNSTIIGHDVMFAGSDEHDFDAESGDDIMVQGESVMRNEGMFGFDWAIFKGAELDAYADLGIPIFTTEQADILRNRFDKTEALSGWMHDDTLIGDNRVFGEIAPGDTVATTEGIFFNDGLDQAGIDRIAGLADIVSVGATGFFESGNILLGGAGSDNLRGNAGDDILDGDRWLNVRIRITGPDEANAPGNEIATVDSLNHTFPNDFEIAAWQGRSLFEMLVDRTVSPSQLHIVREVLTEGASSADTDIAFFNDIRANYTIVENADGSTTITHNTVSNVIDPLTGRNLLSDGVDTLRNIEFARFSDGVQVAIGNQLAVGAPTISGTQNILSVDLSAISDANGLPPGTVFTIVWQRSVDGVNWSNVGTGPTFDTGTNTDFHRVVVSFTDGDGFPESVISQMTARVGTTGVNGSVAVPFVGTLGPDLINGRAGNDVLSGLDGADIINPGAGNDAVNAGAGADTIVYDIDNGLGGADTLAGGADVDTLEIVDTGGADAETLSVVYSGGRITQIEGGGSVAADIERVTAALGAGIDTLAYSATSAAVTVDLAAGAASGFVSIAGVDNVSGTINADSFTSNASNNALAGGAGGDTYMFGLADGADQIQETAGADAISIAAGGAALDSLNFADTPGDDLVISFNGQSITVVDHFAALANEVETLTFDSGSYAGYALAGSYALSADDAGTRAAAAGIGSILSGDGAGQILQGSTARDMLFGNGGADVLNGDAGDDLLIGGLGVDSVNGGAGDDTMVWGAGDGRDFVNGGIEGAGGDTFAVFGDASAETYRVYSRAAWMALNGGGAQGNGGIALTTEIVVTRNGTGQANIIAELSDIEEIQINTGDGADTVLAIGDFSPTSLSFNTITVNGSAGDDTVDVSQLQSAHRILFRSNGGNDTIVGTLRPQDVVELPNGADLSTYELVDNGNGTKTFSNGSHSITFSGPTPPQFLPPPPPAGNDEGVSGAFEYTPSDLEGLMALVNGQAPPNGEDDAPTGARNLSGHGNNQANPLWASADQPFIRITNPHYGAPDGDGNRAINPVFDGLDPRTISNVLGTQEAGLPHAGNDANIFFMAMGQYIDHGLDFIGKGGNGTIQIGAPGGGAPGSGNPADLTRATVAGYDANGVPQHINRTSPYVDQNQAYGSNELVGQFLREGDGNGGLGAHLFAGVPDPSNTDFRLLPTLRELILEHWQNNTVFHSDSLPGGAVAFRDYFPGLVTNGVIDEAMLPGMTSDFMGSSHALLLDSNPFIGLVDHYVVGDGRGNENFALTSIHTIWARNHNFHVEGLEAAGFQGSAEELFQAAKMINEAEYQRVVFDEYLDTLLGGLRSQGTHGFEEYDPNANAGISHEFAAAVFRFGHSLIGQTMTVLDADGNPTQVQLFDAFLNPTNDPAAFTTDPAGVYTPQPGYSQHGVNAIIGGVISQAAEDVDFNIVDAVRNDLVRINADLFAFNVARGWDVGLGTLNQVRKDLAASTNPYVSEAVGFAGGDLSAYASWEDFQQRNDLSDAVIDQFKQAYPDLVLAAADIDAFREINPDIDIAMQGDGTGVVKGIDRVDLWVGGLAEKHINGGLVGETFWVVLSEQFERLQDGDRFYYISRFDNFDFYENFVDGQEFADIVARNTGMTNLPEHMFRTDPIDAPANDASGDPPDDTTVGDPSDDGTSVGGQDDDDDVAGDQDDEADEDPGADVADDEDGEDEDDQGAEVADNDDDATGCDSDETPAAADAEPAPQVGEATPAGSTGGGAVFQAPANIPEVAVANPAAAQGAAGAQSGGAATQTGAMLVGVSAADDAFVFATGAATGAPLAIEPGDHVQTTGMPMTGALALVGGAPFAAAAQLAATFESDSGAAYAQAVADVAGDGEVATGLAQNLHAHGL